MNPPAFNLRYLPSPEELARYAADEFVALLICRKDFSAPFGVALSGGRIAPIFYRQFVESTRRSPARFENVHFFWADERCVPPTDLESNYALAQTHLFKPLNIPSPNVHRIRGEDDYSVAAKEAEAELCRIMPLTDAGIPLLDLVVLGLGEDGHVASLFPIEGREWVDDPRVYRHVVATKPPPSRVTLGYQPIIRARDAWVLASGPGKLDTLTQLLAGKDLPLNRIIARRPAKAKEHAATTIFQDFFKPEKNV
ncbi:MAG TPA: 6-phosphogluconolactonase [Verrucomicrobiae bacterium]|jgi:6-phosphogluconolactonase|nr:6-phosphogluconolactonase [Verrucomicrobiae bacterium]